MEWEVPGELKTLFGHDLFTVWICRMNIISKVSLNQGLSHYVLVVYRHAFATAVIAPFAFFFERPVVDQNFYYAGLKLTSPTFSCAMRNMLPAMTCVMTALYRMEKRKIKVVRCQAKLVGTLVTVGGVMLMTLYKGSLVHMSWTKHLPTHPLPSSSSNSDDREWIIGSLFLSIATLAWDSLLVLQAKVIETYQNHQLSLTALVCFIGTLQAVAVTFVVERNPSVWRIGWGMNLLACFLCCLVIKKNGPVFATAFSPLMIIVAIMGSFILSEQIYLGSVVGSFLIVMGLYSVPWGKHKESMEANKVIETDQEGPPILHLKPPNNYHHHVDPKNVSEDRQLFICAYATSKSEKIPEATHNNMNQCCVSLKLPHEKPITMRRQQKT
ncbi:hypothetical protein K1719_013649 [Acacia pycnantha]|nr:hypothetical protein K1719_013649 [Acacia pycnantha]